MNIDALVDMTDEEFRDCVVQAFKRRDAFPEWWAAVLHEDVIDDTEKVIQDALNVADRQALEPEKYRYAAGFAKKLRNGALAEIRLARIVGSS